MVEVATGVPVWAIGVMTGTSMDAVDVAMIRTDGETIAALGDGASYPISDVRRDLIGLALKHLPAIETERLRAIRAGSLRLPWLIGLHRELITMTDFAVEQLLLRNGVWLDGPTQEPWITIAQDLSAVVLGVHGQTVLHRPEEAFTMQLGMPDERADWIGNHFTQITDFRTADMEAGGQGAPLVPFYHFALAKRIAAAEPLAFLNIGGVANVTWVDPSKERPENPGALMAFDTGPGNALVNDWMLARTGEPMDRDGATAAAGRVRRERLASNWGRDYLRRRPPKSLDRNDFHGLLPAMEGLRTEDGAATLTAFTAECVAEAVRHMPAPPSRWLVCGGGRRNATMMRMLAGRLDAPVEPVEAVGLDGDMLEAQAFAFLAVRVLRGLPTSAPSTTGCRQPVCGGRIRRP